MNIPVDQPKVSELQTETLSDERLIAIRDNADNGMASRVMAGELLIARVGLTALATKRAVSDELVQQAVDIWNDDKSLSPRDTMRKILALAVAPFFAESAKNPDTQPQATTVGVTADGLDLVEMVIGIDQELSSLAAKRFGQVGVIEAFGQELEGLHARLHVLAVAIRTLLHRSALIGIPGAEAEVWRTDWPSAPRDGTWVRLRYPSGDETRLYWSTHYSINGLGGCWSDGFCTMSDLDFTGWLALPPAPTAGREQALDEAGWRLITDDPPLDREFLGANVGLCRHDGSPRPDKIWHIRGRHIDYAGGPAKWTWNEADGGGYGIRLTHWREMPALPTLKATTP